MSAAGLMRWIVPLLALAGIADSGYLAALHFRGEIPPCLGYSGCEQVNTSPYAEIFGMPIAAFGAAIFVAILLAGLWRARTGGKSWFRATLVLYALVLASTLFMAYLTAVELLVLHAICYWCLGMAAITVILMILVIRDIWGSTSTQGAS